MTTIKNNTIEMELDWSTLLELLDDVAKYVNGLPNEKLINFIGNAFYFTNGPTEGASNFTKLIFKANPRYLELLPALRAGDISFDSLCNILTTEIRVGNEPCHI